MSCDKKHNMCIQQLMFCNNQRMAKHQKKVKEDEEGAIDKDQGIAKDENEVTDMEEEEDEEDEEEEEDDNDGNITGDPEVSFQSRQKCSLTSTNFRCGLNLSDLHHLSSATSGNIHTLEPKPLQFKISRCVKPI